MKVESNSIAPTSNLPSAEATSLPNTMQSSPMDIFYKMLMANNASLPLKTPELPPTENLPKAGTDTMLDPATQPDPYLMGQLPFLLQLGMLDTKPATPTPTSDIQLPSPAKEKAEPEKLSLSIPTALPKEQIEMITPKEIAVPTTKTDLDEIENTAISPVMTAPTAPIIPSNDIKLDANPIKDSPITPLKKPVTSPAHQIMSSSPRPVLNTQPSPLMNLNQQIEHQSRSDISVNIFKEQMTEQNTALLADKAKKTFAQLSQFINGHTATINTNSTQFVSASMNTPGTDILNRFKETQVTDYEPIVQLQPQLAAHLSHTFDAKINVFPPELGHVIAKLKMENNNTDIVITAQNTQVKEIIESNLPQLREHFKQADINLTHIQVEAGGLDKQQTANQQRQSPYQAETFADSREQEETKTKQAVINKKNNELLVDTYA